MLFKLPIEYVDSVELHKLRESIVDDLELTEHKTSYTYKDNNDHITTEHVENTELEVIEEEDKDKGIKKVTETYHCLRPYSTLKVKLKESI